MVWGARYTGFNVTSRKGSPYPHLTDHCFFCQSNNVTMQKKYKAEISELHDALLQVKRDYDLLRMEFEQNLKANEQTGLSLFI